VAAKSDMRGQTWAFLRPPKMTLARFMVLLVLTTLLIEAVLAFRLWAQLSGMALDAGSLRALYDTGGLLTSPFRSLDTGASQRNDILQLSTVIAVEAYVIGAVALFGLALLVRMAFRAIEFQFDREGVIVSRRAAVQNGA
jgi:hypothetical protein